MTHLLRHRFFLCTVTIFTLVVALPLSAQIRDGVMGELVKEIGDVEKKVPHLAADASFRRPSGPAKAAACPPVRLAR